MTNFNLYSNFMGAQLLAERLKGFRYVENLDIDCTDERAEKSNDFVVQNKADGKYYIATANPYPYSFNGKTFKWTKPWQGLGMPVSVWMKDMPVQFCFQYDNAENPTVCAWATADMFDTAKPVKMGGKWSYRATTFYVTDLETKETKTINI